MARKNGTGIGGKFLNLIGLVDDEIPQDTYGDEYESGSYGQRKAYQPQRSQRAQERPRQEMTSRRSVYEPTARSPRMNRASSQRSTGYESRYESARTVRGGDSSRRSGYAEREDSRVNGRYDYSPRSSSRFGSYGEAPSRFDDQGGNLPQTRQGRQNRRDESAGKQKTMMYNLYSLGDCKEVIDQLIQNYTVILTLSDMEPSQLQRAVDTLSGAVFALKATIRKASEYTYLIAPRSVEVDDPFDAERDY